MEAETEKNSLKQLFQEIVSDRIEVLQGFVKSVSPLKIQIKGDEKLTIGANITYVPWHLTDYKTEFSFDDPTVRSNISVGHRLESHATLIEYPDTPAETSKKVILKGEISFDEKIKHTITVYNALKVGEEVYILGFNRGKQYYVLDRVAV